MPSTFRISIPTVLALTAGAVLAAFGCGGLGVSASSFGGGNEGPQGTYDPAAEDGGGGAPVYLTDASLAPDAAAGPSKYNGNPLCVTPSSGVGACNPQLDNFGETEAGTADDACHALLDQDGGETYACHVSKTNGVVAPVCTAAGSSTTTCNAPSECKAGYECVGGQAGECRRYCCDPTTCEPSTFCDVQPIHGVDVIVPVCMPITQCELLGSPCREAVQQCGIVDQTKGITSCIDIGPRVEGEECETDHCAKDLVCLGSLGSRKCFQLCDTQSASSCTMGQRCLTNSVTFKGVNVGICGQ